MENNRERDRAKDRAGDGTKDGTEDRTKDRAGVEERADESPLSESVEAFLGRPVNVVNTK
jgi:hypothetical protein